MWNHAPPRKHIQNRFWSRIQSTLFPSKNGAFSSECLTAAKITPVKLTNISLKDMYSYSCWFTPEVNHPGFYEWWWFCFPKFLEKMISIWWFQPRWKRLVKLDHLPKEASKNHLKNHHFSKTSFEKNSLQFRTHSCVVWMYTTGLNPWKPTWNLNISPSEKKKSSSTSSFLRLPC